DRASGAVGLQPRGSAAWLVGAGYGAAVAAWTLARPHSAAPAAGSAHARFDLGRRRAGGVGAAVGAKRLRPVAADRSGSARWAARARARHNGRRLRVRRGGC